MPRGLQEQKCPADVKGNAFQVANITIGESKEMGYMRAAKAQSGRASALPMSEGEHSGMAQQIAAGQWI